MNPPHGCLSHGELCYIGVYHGVLGHFWGQKITFPKSIGICSGVVVEAGNRPETPKKVILVVMGGAPVGQAATCPPVACSPKIVKRAYFRQFWVLSAQARAEELRGEFYTHSRGRYGSRGVYGPVHGEFNYSTTVNHAI